MVEKDDNRSQQLREMGGKDQDTGNQTVNTVQVVLGDSNATLVHFKDPDVFNVSQSGDRSVTFQNINKNYKQNCETCCYAFGNH